MDLINRIKTYPKLFKTNGHLNIRCFNSTDFSKSKLFKEILDRTNFLSKESKIPERIYCIFNNITEHPKCFHCNSNVRFIDKNKGYTLHCSNLCSSRAIKVKEKIKRTNLERYGNENYNNRTKAKRTNLERYGNENYNNRTKAKKTKLERYGNENYVNVDKAKTTCIKKYGVEHFSRTVIYKEKIKRTNLERYGVEWNLQSIEVKKKASKTKLERYGDENFNNRSKFKNTCLERYGTETPLQSNKVKEKIKRTNLERYGVEYYNQKDIIPAITRLYDKKWLCKQHIDNKKSVMNIANDLSVNYTTVLKYIIKHNIDRQLYSYSHPQLLLETYIYEQYNTIVITNNRKIIKPYEIDIFLPEYNLAIEYNGIYWHRPEVYGSKEEWLNYHQNKIDMCNKKGIKLLHIWEKYGNHNALLNDALNSIIDNNLEEIYENIYNTKKEK